LVRVQPGESHEIPVNRPARATGLIAGEGAGGPGSSENPADLPCGLGLGAETVLKHAPASLVRCALPNELVASGAADAEPELVSPVRPLGS
jgi:hypothetical protein